MCSDAQSKKIDENNGSYPVPVDFFGDHGADHGKGEHHSRVGQKEQANSESKF